MEVKQIKNGSLNWQTDELARYLPKREKAWEILANKVYVQPAQVGQGTLTNAPLFERKWTLD
ncbi:hypothetical protein NXX23_20755 [Bacteroides ovatus]|nr:hypothetical protein [Bacteroides ovatus]